MRYSRIIAKGVFENKNEGARKARQSGGRRRGGKDLTGG